MSTGSTTDGLTSFPNKWRGCTKVNGRYNILEKLDHMDITIDLIMRSNIFRGIRGFFFCWDTQISENYFL